MAGLHSLLLEYQALPSGLEDVPSDEAHHLPEGALEQHLEGACFEHPSLLLPATNMISNCMRLPVAMPHKTSGSGTRQRLYRPCNIS